MISKKLKPRYPTSGSRAGRAGLPDAIGGYSVAHRFLRRVNYFDPRHHRGLRGPDVSLEYQSYGAVKARKKISPTISQNNQEKSGRRGFLVGATIVPRQMLLFRDFVRLTFTPAQG